MIDHLEELLEESREDPLTGSRRAAVLPAGSSPAREPEEEKRPAAASEPPEAADGAGSAVREIGAESGRALPEASDRTPETETDPAWGDWLPRTEEGTEAAGLLLRALSRAGRSARLLRTGSGVVTVTLPETGAGSGGLDVEALDLAVQRDARRYDGGFTLY